MRHVPADRYGLISGLARAKREENAGVRQTPRVLAGPINISVARARNHAKLLRRVTTMNRVFRARARCR